MYGEALHRGLHHGFADVVEDDIDTTIAGRLEHDGGEVGVVVVDRDVGAELAAPRDLLVGAGGREDARAGVLRELDRRRAGATGGRVDQHALTRLQLRAVEQPEPGQVEREVERGCVGERDRVRHLERRNDRTDRVLGEPAVRTFGHGNNALALPITHAVTGRVDDAHDLHAGAVRQFRPHHHVAAGDAFEIVEVQRDRLHAHAQLAGFGEGIGTSSRTSTSSG